MKKRLMKKLAKRLGLRATGASSLPAASISVTKVDVALTSLNAETEEPVRGYELSAVDVALMAHNLRKWIADGKFVNSPTGGASSHVDSCTRTLFRDTGLGTPSSPIWFIGDLHGDMAALKALTRFAREQNRRDGVTTPTRLFFLGDFTDGAPFSAEVVAWVMRMRAWNMRPQPVQQRQEVTHPTGFEVLAVAGNHDDGLRFVEDYAGGKFVSSVSPSTFAEELNERLKQGNGRTWKAFGLAAIEFFKTLPRMVMLDKIVMVAHGGVPHSDIVIAKREDLDSSQAQSDFVWNRLHETAPKKVPNRESHGSQQGVRDLEGFIARLADTPGIGFAPKVLIRGHDHHEGNFKRYENYKSCSVLTLNAFTINRGPCGQKYRDLALLRWVPSETDKMTLFRLKFRDGTLEQLWRLLSPEKQNTSVASEPK